MTFCRHTLLRHHCLGRLAFAYHITACIYIRTIGLLISRVYAFSGNKKAYLIVLLSFGLVRRYLYFPVHR
jgi:hypothetical protein